MAKLCQTCGRERDKEHREKGCNLVTLTDGTSVHASRIEPGGDIRKLIEAGVVQVERRWRVAPIESIGRRFRR